MEGKFINRFESFCNSLSSLNEARNRILPQVLREKSLGKLRVLTL